MCMDRTGCMIIEGQISLPYLIWEHQKQNILYACMRASVSRKRKKILPKWRWKSQWEWGFANQINLLDVCFSEELRLSCLKMRLVEIITGQTQPKAEQWITVCYIWDIKGWGGFFLQAIPITSVNVMRISWSDANLQIVPVLRHLSRKAAAYSKTSTDR